jgi:hypothetical protein
MNDHQKQRFVPATELDYRLFQRREER